MVQNQEQPVGKITFSILIALSLSHCLNDLYNRFYRPLILYSKMT